MTPERAVEAAKLIQRGAVFPLNWDMRMPDPPLFSRARFEHEVTGEPPSIGHDDVLHGWNTQSSSQWDGFRHVRHPVHGHYGGVPDEEHGMNHWASRAGLSVARCWSTSVGGVPRKVARCRWTSPMRSRPTTSSARSPRRAPPSSRAMCC